MVLGFPPAAGSCSRCLVGEQSPDGVEAGRSPRTGSGRARVCGQALDTGVPECCAAGLPKPSVGHDRAVTHARLHRRRRFIVRLQSFLI